MRYLASILLIASAPSTVFALWSESVEEGMVWTRYTGTTLLVAFDYPDGDDMPSNPTSSINLAECLGNVDGVLVVSSLYTLFTHVNS
jgi:hypothetical protein